MAVPTPTSEFLDLNTATFTETGGVVAIPDQHSESNVAYEFDGSDDRLLTSIQPLSLNSGNVHSLSFWIQPAIGGTISNSVVTQYNAAGFAAYRMFYDASNKRLSFQWFSGTNSNFLSLVSNTDTIVPGQWTHVVATIKGTEATDSQAYINGVETSYQARDKIGAGFTDITLSLDLRVGSSEAGAGGQFFLGSISRLKFWEGTQLSAAEILEEFNNEVAAIIIPTPDITYIDAVGMQSLDWAQSGSPTFIPDQHNLTDDVAFQSDGVDNKLQQSPLITSADGAIHTMSFWFRSNTVGGGGEVWFGQTDINSFTDRGFYIFATASSLRTVWVSSATDTLQSQSSDTAQFDSQWHHLLFTINGALGNCELFLDGAEMNYSDKNTKQGAGYSGEPSPVKDITVGADIIDQNPANSGFNMSRLKIWRSVSFSAAQVLKEYNAECTAVVVPDTTDEFLDITTTPFTTNGNPDLADGPINTDVTFDFDKVDDFLSSTVEPVPDGSTKFTIAYWAKKLSDGVTHDFVNQRATIEAGQYYYSRSGASDNFSFTVQSGGNFFQSTSAASTLLSNEDYVYLTAVVNVGNQTIDLYKNGAELAYTAHNSVTGSPAATMTPSTLGVASLFNNSFDTGLLGSVARIKFWNEVELSSCQILKEFNAELATSPTIIPISETTQERLNGWAIYDPSLQRVSTLTEPFDLGNVIANAAISGQILTQGNITRLNDWSNSDPALGVAGNSVFPFLLGDILDEAMGTPPFATQLTQKQIDDLNNWELSDPGLKQVETPEEPFNLGDTLNLLLTRSA